jgi:tetratricopeptide (TPR) repeat protein
MRISDTLHSIFSRKGAICPNEAEVLAYFESRLSVRYRAHLERHFASCDDCRELLALLGRESAEMYAPLAHEAVREQTNRVLSLIRSDDLNRGKPEHKQRTFPGFDVFYPRLASAVLMICTIAISAIVFLSQGQRPAEAAMEALALAVKDGRNTEARVSGGLEYSRYSVTRGPESKGDELQFDRAISQLRFAWEDTAPVNDKLVLARVYLARGTPDDTGNALTILDQLATRGVETPEALNDKGVALFEMGNYEDAIAYFAKALAKSPNYNEALFNKALAEERAHHNDQAKQDWEQFIYQSSDDSWKAEARKNLGDLTRSNGR